METPVERPVYATPPVGLAASGSAVSWAAIFGGGVAATSLSLILFVLGIGLGFTSISPWSREGVDAGTFGMLAIIWIILTSVASSGLGGYLAGRLRTRWLDTPRDEVFFRDTAHGFLAWGTAAILTAAVLAGATTSLVGAGARTAATVAGGISEVAGSAAGAAAGAGASQLSTPDEGGLLSYYMDRLFRFDPNAPAGQQQAQPQAQAQGDQANNGDAAGNAGNQEAAPAEGPRVGVFQAPNLNASRLAEPPGQQRMDEIGRVIRHAFTTGELADDDVRYIGQQVANYTRISQQEAEQRVREAYDALQTQVQEIETAARETADTARAAAVHISLWSFVALLAGAFAGSLAATWGGRQRDA